MATNLSALKINPLKKSLNPLGALTGTGTTTKQAQVPFSPSYDPVKSALSHQKELQAKIDENVAKQSAPIGLPALDFSSAITGETAKQQFTKALTPTPTGGGFMPPTPEAKQLPVRTEEEGIMDSIIPKASAMSEEEIGSKIDSGEYDDLINQLADEGYSPEDITQALKDELATVPSETTPAKEEPGFLQSVGQGIQNIVGGAVSEVPKIAGNVLDVATKLSPGYYLYGKPEEALWGGKAGKAGKEFVQKYGAYEPQSTGAKVGEIGADIAASSMIPGGVLKSGAGVAENIARGAVQGAIEMGKYAGVSEGRLPTVGETVGGAVMGGVVPAIGAGLSKAKSALQLSGLVTPAKLDLVKNMIKDEGGKTPSNVAKWMQDRNIWGTKESIIKQLDAVVDASKGAVDTYLESVKKTYDLPVAKQAVNQLFDKVSKVPGLEKETENIVEQFGKKELTLSELNALKRQIDNTYDIYKASSYGDPKAGLVAKGLNNMRNEIKTFIETEAKKEGLPSISELNNQTSVAKALSINIGKKESSEAARELISMFAPSGVGAGLGAVGGAYSNDPYGWLKGAIVGGLAGSTLLKTGAAKILNALDPSETAIVKKFINSRGTTEIPEGLMQKMRNLSSNKTKNVISSNISDSTGISINPLEGLKKFDLSKNKKGFINPKAIGQDLGVIKKPVSNDLINIIENYKKIKDYDKMDIYYNNYKKTKYGIEKQYLDKFDYTFEELKDLDENILNEAKKIGLTPEELHSTYYGYTNTNYDYYNDINSVLRKGQKLEGADKLVAEIFEKTLNKIKPYKGNVYRGINAGKGKEIVLNLKPGEMFIDNGFLSSSKSIKEAQNFSLKGGVMMKIKSKNGRDISPISYATEEQEIIFPKGSKFKFLGKDSKGIYNFVEIYEQANKLKK